MSDAAHPFFPTPTATANAHDAGASPAVTPPRVAVIGAGPAGLMAAEALASRGLSVAVYDRMATPGRKFLLAGRGGLNLTHSEPAENFRRRYAARGAEVGRWLDAFDADALRAWVHGLGIETFVGSSGRVFPVGMKSAPLLRAWLARLRAAGVEFHQRHRWLGWPEAEEPAAAAHEPTEASAEDRGEPHVASRDGRSGLRFDTPGGEILVHADAVVLALGGASWRRFGSDGAWVPMLEAAGVAVTPLAPANCGFDVAGRPAIEGTLETRRGFFRELLGADSAEPTPGWSAHFADRWAGRPLKSVALYFDRGEESDRSHSTDGDGGNAGIHDISGRDARGERDGRDAESAHFQRRGECVATVTGLEGSLIYAASALLRDEIARKGAATLHLDLLPDWPQERVLAEAAHPRGARSLSTHLKTRLGIDGIKAGLLHELLEKAELADPAVLAARIKALPLTLLAARPLDEAISTAGGVALEALDEGSMLAALPGVFVAGEMLDWEAPTGGYLLNACMASGKAAGEAAASHALAGMGAAGAG